MIFKLLPYMRKYRFQAILCPLLMFLETAADVMMPFLMARIIDIGIANEDVDFIIRTGLIMIGLALFALFCGALASRLAALASQGMGSELRQGMFDRIQDFSFANLDRFSIPSLITRLTNDVNNVQMVTMMSLRMMVRAPVMMIMALFMAMTINRELANVFLIAIPVLAISLTLIISTAYPRFRKLQKKIDQLNMTIQENLVNIRVVKAFVRSIHEIKRFRRANDDLKRSSIQAIRIVILNMPVMQLIMYSCIISIIWFGGGLIVSGGMETGELISFINYVTQILMSLMMLSFLFIMHTRARASAERINEVLETKVDLKSPPDGWKEVADGSIEMKNVSFRYPYHQAGEAETAYRNEHKTHIKLDAEEQKPVLADINFRIESGSIVGIIGATGSAKTSLVQLIPRLYDVSEGQVLVGGLDVRSYDLPVLRDAVAMVLQNNTLFSGSIRDNLLWGNENASDEEIHQACEAAQAWSFITAMPNGLDTWLGQGGVNVSGGQKQRLCIARALLKNPRVLILDDSTSAVDMATEARIRKAFSSQLAGITTIIIAQRIRSIMDADLIIVLDDGKIDGIGTHEEMLQNNEIYRDVYESQQEGAIAG